MLFSTYLILWIQTFPQLSEDEGKSIYLQIMLISVLVSCIVFPFVGKLVDTYEAIKLVPYAFVLRSISAALFCFVKDPESY